MSSGHKFTMSNGTEGIFRGQAPPSDAFAKAGMPARKRGYDTEHERQAVGPQHQKQGYADHSTGFTSQCAELATGGVMEQALQAKLKQTFQQGVEDGYNARLEEEAEQRALIVSQEQIDAKEDERKNDENADDDLEKLRARRREQMKEAHDKRLKYQGLGHGEYSEIEEEAFLKTVTASERAVVHFYHKQFEKCKVIDMHLRKCARKFMGTRFVRLDSEKAPFFVDKLQVRTLPCVVVFNDGVAKGRQVGYEGLGTEEFETVQLAWRLKSWEGIEEDFGPDDDINWD